MCANPYFDIFLNYEKQKFEAEMVTHAILLCIYLRNAVYAKTMNKRNIGQFWTKQI